MAYNKEMEQRREKLKFLKQKKWFQNNLISLQRQRKVFHNVVLKEMLDGAGTKHGSQVIVLPIQKQP